MGISIASQILSCVLFLSEDDLGISLVPEWPVEFLCEVFCLAGVWGEVSDFCRDIRSCDKVT